MSTTPQGAQISVRFALRPAVFELRGNFSYSGHGTGGATIVKRMSKKVKVDMLTDVYYYPKGPNLCSFRSTASRFRVRGNFSYSGHGTGGATTVKPMYKTITADTLTDVYCTPRGPNRPYFCSTIVNQWKI